MNPTMTKEKTMKLNRIVILAGMLLLVLCNFADAWQAGGEEMLKKYPGAADWLRQKHLNIAQDPQDALKYGYMLVYGEGLPSLTARTAAEKRLTAESAANVIASRNLVEHLSGFALTGERTVRDKRELYDVVKKTSSGFVRGTEEIYKEYNEQDETALVIMKVGMGGPKGFATELYEKILGNPGLRADLMGRQRDYRPSPVPVDGAYDALIIDATAEPFRPALINRVFNIRGEVLYDPSKVKKEVLVQHGCGEYTNTIEKAREALALRGARNPLVIKAKGTVNQTDITVSGEDAVRIFSADQRSGFFAAGKVAFVLK